MSSQVLVPEGSSLTPCATMRQKMDDLHILASCILDALGKESLPDFFSAVQKFQDAFHDPILSPYGLDHFFSSTLPEVNQTILQKVFGFLQIRSSINRSTGKEQEVITFPIYTLLLPLKDSHIHTATSKGKEFTCPYHMESLLTHLMMNMLLAMRVCETQQRSPEFTWKICLAALFHDIAKRDTLRLIDVPDVGTWTGFPAHGELGQMKWQLLWHSEMDAMGMDIQSFQAIGHLIGIHMCGYHGDRTNKFSQYKRRLLSMEEPTIKEMLEILRITDHMGGFAEPDRMEYPDHFRTQQPLFREDIAKPFPFQQFLTEAGLRKDKTIVCLAGISGAGKSHFAQLMENEFGNMAHVERDACMMASLTGTYQRLYGDPYAKLYDAYKAYADLEKFEKDFRNKIPEQQATLLRQREPLRKKVVEAIQAYNVIPNLPPIQDPDWSRPLPNTDKEFRSRVDRALQDPISRVIVVDTLKTFSDGVGSILPDSARHVFRIYVHIQNYTPRHSGTNVGGNLKQLLSVAGPFGPDNLLPSWACHRFLASVSTSNAKEKSPWNQPEDVTGSLRPHYNLVATRTPSGEVGYQYSMDRLRYFFDRLGGTDTLIQHAHPERIMGVYPINHGLDFTLMDMDLTQLLGEVLRRHGFVSIVESPLTTIQDRSLALQNTFAWFGSQGFICSFPLMRGGIAAMDPGEIDSFAGLLGMDMDPRSGAAQVPPTDTAQHLSMELFARSVVLIRYQERPGNQYWRNKWARQARGSIFHIHPVTAKITSLNQKLPRGAEVLTGVLAEAHIEDTQDIAGGKLNTLDDTQIRITRILQTGGHLKAHLSSKGDGSLLTVTVYSGEAKHIMKAAMDVFAPPYVRQWGQMSLGASGDEVLLVPATQGTLWEGGHMQNYMITAILVGSGILTRAQLEEEMTSDPETVFLRFGAVFIRQLLSFYETVGHGETMTFSFEAICRNRRGVGEPKTHTELAISYQRDRLIFLGATICETGYYIPHSHLDQQGVSIPFEQPLYWCVEDGKTVDVMLDSLEHTTLQKMSRADFLSVFVPANRDWSPEMIPDAVLDYEGFVLMTLVTDPSYEIQPTDLIQYEADSRMYKVGSVDGEYRADLRFVYSKIKQVAYYKCHKFRHCNIPYLLQLPESAREIFPLAQFANLVMDVPKFTRCMHLALLTSLRLLHHEDSDIPAERGSQVRMVPSHEPDTPRSPLDIQLGLHFSDCVAAYHQPVASKKGKVSDPFKGFGRASLPERARRMLHFPGTSPGQSIVAVFKVAFPFLDTEHPEVDHILKCILMQEAPWEADFLEALSQIPHVVPYRDAGYIAHILLSCPIEANYSDFTAANPNPEMAGVDLKSMPWDALRPLLPDIDPSKDRYAGLLEACIKATA